MQVYIFRFSHLCSQKSNCGKEKKKVNAHNSAELARCCHNAHHLFRLILYSRVKMMMNFRKHNISIMLTQLFPLLHCNGVNNKTRGRSIDQEEKKTEWNRQHVRKQKVIGQTKNAKKINLFDPPWPPT